MLGQRLLYDVRLTMDDCRGAFTDDVADTIDYTEVMDVIVDVVTTTELLPARAARLRCRPRPSCASSPWTRCGCR